MSSTAASTGRPDRHEPFVRERFDLLHGRFRQDLDRGDYRLKAILKALPRVAGARVLDLGCGKGRFASWLEREGAIVVGLDLSANMLGAAEGLDRVQASAQRLPFRGGAFDAVIAVEVFEHVRAIDAALAEVRRVLRPGGALAVVDKNAGSLNRQRPWLPNLAVKWLDERRGLWMYPPDSPVRERWFWPRAFQRRLSAWFNEVTFEYLLSPAEAASPLFRCMPATRRMTLWTARTAGGSA